MTRSRRRSPARLANDAWEALLTAHAAVLSELNADDIWQELSMRDYDVLYTLAKAGEPIRPRQLEGSVLLSQPALSRLVDRLVGRGLVRRDPDPHDGRGVLLCLTEQGRAAQRRTGARHAATVDRLLRARLSLQDQQELERLCTALATGTPRTEKETAP